MPAMDKNSSIQDSTGVAFVCGYGEVQGSGAREIDFK